MVTAWRQEAVGAKVRPMTRSSPRPALRTALSEASAVDLSAWAGPWFGTRAVVLVTLLSAVSCGPADSTATSFGVGPGTMTVGSTTTSGSSGSSTGSPGSTGTGSTGSTGGMSTGPALDSSTGPELAPDFGLPGPKGCQGKIDFLFVISNSPTMKGHQPQVVPSLPEFITKIQAEFSEFDTHIMVTDTDDFWQMKDCSVCGPGCDPAGTPKLCGAELDACDTTIGAGVTFPSGIDSSARRCELAAGRYITSDDPDPIAAFLCVAKVGSEGGAPRPADAMVAALSWPLLGTNGYPPGCNQGFLRDDALLVVTLISDQYDVDSSGPAWAWLKALKDAKHQDGEAFQLLVITSDRDVVDGICGPYFGSVNRLRTFVNIVPHGKIGSICAPSYGPFFDEAVAEVIQRCESFAAPQ